VSVTHLIASNENAPVEAVRSIAVSQRARVGRRRGKSQAVRKACAGSFVQHGRPRCETGHKRRGVHVLPWRQRWCDVRHIAGTSGPGGRERALPPVASCRRYCRTESGRHAVAGFQNCQGPTNAKGRRVGRLTASPPVARSRFPLRGEGGGLNPRGRTSGWSGVRVRRRSTEGVRSTEC